MSPGTMKWTTGKMFSSLSTTLFTAGLEQNLNFKIWQVRGYFRIHLMSKDRQARKVTILAELIDPDHERNKRFTVPWLEWLSGLSSGL